MSREFVRYPNVVRSVVAGASSPLPDYLQHIASVDMPPTDSEICFQTLMIEFDIVTKARIIELTPMRSELSLTRSEVLIFYSSFADTHRIPMNPVLTQAEVATRVIKDIEDKHNTTGLALQLPDQLDIALDASDDNLTQAVIALAVGTRAIGRGQDVKLVPELSLNRRRMFNWKHCVAPVGFEGATLDPVGDTYHFWHGVMAGMSTYDTEFPKAVCHAKSFVCEQIYGLTAAATNVLRYGVNKHKGRVHDASDKMGFAVGKHWQSQYGQGNGR